MKWKAIYEAAQLASCAYSLIDAQAASEFGDLGYRVAGSFRDDDHQAFVVLGPVGWVLAISGTRFGTHAPDLIADLEISAVELGQGAHVASGPYDGMDKLWEWARSVAPPGVLWTVTGHSLGGERALLTGLFLPHDQIEAIYSFEAPKCGNIALWKQLQGPLHKTVCVINETDLFVGWPFIGPWVHPPIAHLHLLKNDWRLVMPDDFPRFTDLRDHAIAKVIVKLGKIVDATS